MVLTRNQSRQRSESNVSSSDIQGGLQSNKGILTPKSLNKLPTNVYSEKSMSCMGGEMLGSAKKGVLSHPICGKESGGLVLTYQEAGTIADKSNIDAVISETHVGSEFSIPVDEKPECSAPSTACMSAPSEDQPKNQTQNLPDGAEPAIVDILYPCASELQPIEGEVSQFLVLLKERLCSIEWNHVRCGMIDLRRLAVHCPEDCRRMLEFALPYLLKGTKSPRSALCKTSIMTIAELYGNMPGDMIQHTDSGGMNKPGSSLLSQILLKSVSNDKKFVVEEAEYCLRQMAISLDPVLFINFIIPYASHKNPKIRGKAIKSMSLAMLTERFQDVDLINIGLAKIISICAQAITDNSAEGRESSRVCMDIILNSMERDPIKNDIEMSGVERQECEDEDPIPIGIHRNAFLYIIDVLGKSKAIAFFRHLQ
eukprot:jgi/Picsp_1/6534/NSC_03877-R1_protein